MERIDLFGFFLERGRSELGDFLLAYQALGELRGYLEARGVEVLLPVYYPDCRQCAEVPDAHAQLLSKERMLGKERRKRAVISPRATCTCL